jgi:HK97 family phage prohead protease
MRMRPLTPPTPPGWEPEPVERDIVPAPTPERRAAAAPAPAPAAPAAPPSVLTRAAPMGAVTPEKREITILALPWDEPARVYWQGKFWQETFQRGAFRQYIASTAKLPRVNREHTKGATVGKITKLKETDRGLVAVIKVARTAAGEEALNLAVDDMVSASVGYTTGGEFGSTIIDRSAMTRRVVRASLDHLSLVEDPAFKGATVLDVRRR